MSVASERKHSIPRRRQEVMFGIVNSVLVADHPPAVGAGVPAVHRAARVLRALGARERYALDRRGASVSELSRQLDVSKSTMSALLATLEQHNLVERDPATRRFRLGHAVLELAAALSAYSDVREAAQPHLARLRRRSGETAILHLVTGDGRIVIAERDEPAEQLKVVAPIGTGLPDFAGSVAKVLLAALEPGEAETMVARHELPASLRARSSIAPLISRSWRGRDGEATRARTRSTSSA